MRVGRGGGDTNPTHSLNRRLWIFDSRDPDPPPAPPAPPRAPFPAMGLVPPDPAGLPDTGLMSMGDIWLTGDISALAVGPPAPDPPRGGATSEPRRRGAAPPGE